MQVRVEVLLRPDRSQGGQLTIYDALTGLPAMKPIPCLAWAGRSNLPSTGVNGKTPTGDYLVTGTMPAATHTNDLATYGIHPRLKLRGMQGDAKIREQVSADLLRIHGGHMRNGELMSTNGCIRLADVDMQSLLSFLAANKISYPFNLVVRESDALPAIVAGEDAALAGSRT